ncbi:MAG: alpha/beta fold hydrolase [Myxococcaceae bacterium]
MIVVALVLLTSGCASLWNKPLPREAVHHRVKTDDGYELSLVRYEAKGAVTGRPVLLVHGISANERNMDLDDEHSLARYFAEHGREAWTLSLRGTGDSDSADPEHGRPPYSFDAFWQKDLPAAIAYVRAQSGVDRIDYVGHSMGGMIVYAYLSQGGGGLEAVTTLGSPTRLDWGGRILELLPSLKGLYLKDGMAVPVVNAAHLVMPLHGELPNDLFTTLLINRENVTNATWKHLMAYGIADIQGGVATQFVGFIEKGTFASADGKIDFRRDMAKIRNPVFVVAGKNDRIAITPAVKDAYRALGGPKEWMLLGVENGQKADYGHMDLVMGDRAATECWDRVQDFFVRHDHDAL